MKLIANLGKAHRFHGTLQTAKREIPNRQIEERRPNIRARQQDERVLMALPAECLIGRAPW